MSEMSEHRVPMLGASWRRFEDPTLSRDPRIRAVVGALATLPAPAPRAEFRAELRTQLVAIAPRIIAESAPSATPELTDIAPTRKSAAAPARAGGRAAPQHADGVFARLRGVSLGRPLAIAASVLTAFVVLLGGAVWMSQKALPGDTLYGLKRANESFQLWMDGGDNTAKAKDLLRFAGYRVDEASGLASRATADAMAAGPQAGTIDSHTAQLIGNSLGSADADVRDATSLLTKQAVSSKSRSPLQILTDWAPSQLARLRALAAAVPNGSLKQRARSSAWVVSAATNRVKALAPVVAKGCVGASSDALGVEPTTCASGPSVPLPGTGAPSGKPRKTNGSGVGTNSGTGVVPVTPLPTDLPGVGTSGGTSGSKQPPIHLPTTLPTVPLPTKSLPVSISSCGVGVSLGPVGINLGNCPSH
jgi:hypothetical protein